MSAAGLATAFPSTDLVWITEEQVASLVDLNDAMGALRSGFIEEASGNARTMDKALGTWDNGAMHALGSMMLDKGYAGFKTWAHTKQGATAIFSLFDVKNGRLLAVLEAATLGQIRTSAVSGVGTDLLAPADASELTLIGTGAQALTQVAAVAAVRPLHRLRVFSPTTEKRAAFVKRARAVFHFEVLDCGSIEEATRDASIVILITRANEPFFHANFVAPRTLIIAAGAILPSNAEFFPDVLERATSVVVDSLGNAQKGSRELMAYYGPNEANWHSVKTLGALLQANVVPAADRDITLFKPMGSGLSDLSVAIMAYERACENSLGIRIAQPHRVTPKWRAIGAASQHI